MPAGLQCTGLRVNILLTVIQEGEDIGNRTAGVNTHEDKDKGD